MHPIQCRMDRLLPNTDWHLVIQNKLTSLCEFLYFSSESDDEKQNDEQLDKKEKNPSREDKHSTDTTTPTESKTTRKRKGTLFSFQFYSFILCMHDRKLNVCLKFPFLLLYRVTHKPYLVRMMFSLSGQHKFPFWFVWVRWLVFVRSWFEHCFISDCCNFV